VGNTWQILSQARKVVETLPLSWLTIETRVKSDATRFGTCFKLTSSTHSGRRREGGDLRATTRESGHCPLSRRPSFPDKPLFFSTGQCLWMSRMLTWPSSALCRPLHLTAASIVNNFFAMMDLSFNPPITKSKMSKARLEFFTRRYLLTVGTVARFLWKSFNRALTSPAEETSPSIRLHSSLNRSNTLWIAWTTDIGSQSSVIFMNLSG